MNDIDTKNYKYKSNKYRIKYNKLQTMLNEKKPNQNQQYSGEKLMTFDEIDNYYGDKYRFWQLYNISYTNLKMFIRYIQKTFGIDKYLNIAKIFSNKISDADFYKLLRKVYHKNPSEIRNYQEINNKSKIPKKVNNITSLISEFDLFSAGCKKILDVGTEDVRFLSDLEKATKCPVIGSNISDGFSHYVSFEESSKTNKIIFYDGTNFPFTDNEFDLATVIVVAHHVENLELFLKDLCRISKNIYIRDDDITDDSSKMIQEIQHELYDGVLVPGKPYPTRPITNEQIVNILEKYHFKIIYNKINDYFTRPFTLVASKISGSNTTSGSKISGSNTTFESVEPIQ